MSRSHEDAPTTVASEDEGGVSLVEMLVSLAAGSIACILVFPIVQVVSSVTSTVQAMTSASEQSESVIENMMLTIGSADSTNVCFPANGTAASNSCPSDGATSGNTLRVLSNIFNTCKWEQWSVSSSGELQEMTWPNGSSGTPTPSEIPLAGPVENSTLSPVPSVFSLDATGHLLTVTLAVEGSVITGSSSSAGVGQTVVTSSTLALLGSDTSTGSC